MQGRAFLDLARELVLGGTEAHWRGTVGRAYYALLLCRETLFHWGFRLPPRDNVHTFVRLRFVYPADADLKSIGMALEKLGSVRNRADYDLSAVPILSSDVYPRQAILDAAAALDLLNAIVGDATRGVAAIAAIRKAFP